MWMPAGTAVLLWCADPNAFCTALHSASKVLLVQQTCWQSWMHWW